jgi:hypothetical protein
MPPAREIELRLRVEEARARRQMLAELGLPEEVAYHRLALRGSGSETEPLQWEQGEVVPDGRVAPKAAFTTLGKWKQEWSGYAFVGYAVHEEWAPRVAGPGLVPWTLHPNWQPLPLLHVRFTVRYADLPIYLDTRWQRDGEWAEILAGLEYRNNDKERERVLAGRELLHAMGTHRPKGGTWTMEEFLSRIEGAMPDTKNEWGGTVFGLAKGSLTKRAVADGIGCGETTIDDLINRYWLERGVDLDWSKRLKPALRRWKRGTSLFDLLGIDKSGIPGISRPETRRR